MRPEEIAVAVWVLLLVALGWLFQRTARRMTRLAGQTRALTAYQSAIESIAIRTAAAIDPVVDRLDEIRRHSGNPAQAAELVAPASDVLTIAVVDARALVTPDGLLARTAAVIAELERAGRALDLVDHGLAGLVDARGPRELEIQTALKRGALNLRHARDGIAGVAADVRELRAGDLRGAARSSFAVRSAPLPVWSPGPESPADAPSDPIM